MKTQFSRFFYGLTAIVGIELAVDMFRVAPHRIQ
jgi:hypothetical protein